MAFHINGKQYNRFFMCVYRSSAIMSLFFFFLFTLASILTKQFSQSSTPLRSLTALQLALSERTNKQTTDQSTDWTNDYFSRVRYLNWTDIIQAAKSLACILTNDWSTQRMKIDWKQFEFIDSACCYCRCCCCSVASTNRWFGILLVLKC